MQSGKRYYWLKLQEDFFSSKRIKKLRRLAGGDTYTIIYLKMQLLAMRTDGILTYSGLEDDFASELALDLDEEPDNVDVTIRYLLSCGLMETSDNKEFFIPYAVSNTGSEGSSAKRVREYRARKALPCNGDVTQVKQICNGEIEKEKEKDIIEYSNEYSCPEQSVQDEKKDKKKRKKSDPIPEDHKAYKAAKWLSKQIKKRMPERKDYTEDDLQRWARDIEKINRIDGYDWPIISDILVFSQEDKFWQTNILSGDALRRNFEKLMARGTAQNGN